jgi:hypothetical protein
MKKVMLLVPVLAVAVGIVFSGCGPSVKVNPAVKFPIPVSDKTPAFLFPVNLGHTGAPGNLTAMGLSVTAGIAMKYGKTVVSGQQLFDLVGNLSWELAETIDSQAQADKWKMTGGAEKVASGLSNTMSAILNKLAALKLIEPGYKFKYIIAVHSHGSAGLGGKTISMNSWGGIYDVETKQICSYINTSNTIMNDEKAVLLQLPNTYNGIIQQLIDGK